MNTQIRWADVESLLRALGASIRQGAGSRIKFNCRGHTLALHVSHNPEILKAYQVELVKNFLDLIGVE